MSRIHNLRTVAMPSCIVIGVLSCRQISVFENWTGNMITPVLIFMMLFFTYCRVDVRRMKLSWLYVWLSAIQLVGSMTVYFALASFDEVVAQGAMICVLAPIAMAAVVIGGMLGADVETMAAYSLFCNMLTAVAAPAILRMAGGGDCSFGMIFTKVAPLLILPFAAGQFCRSVIKPVGRWIAEHSQLSFYMWLVSLTVIIGRTTSFIIDQPEANGMTEIVLAAVALVICICQFLVGRWLGRRYGDTVAGGQSLGQKNTVLAVWMAQSFLDPLSSVAPTAYIVWQNFVNSWQIYKKERSQ